MSPRQSDGPSPPIVGGFSAQCPMRHTTYNSNLPDEQHAQMTHLTQKFVTYAGHSSELISRVETAYNKIGLKFYPQDN